MGKKTQVLKTQIRMPQTNITIIGDSNSGLKEVKKFGNSGAIIVPKAFIGKRFQVCLVPEYEVKEYGEKVEFEA